MFGFLFHVSAIRARPDIVFQLSALAKVVVFVPPRDHILPTELHDRGGDRGDHWLSESPASIWRRRSRTRRRRWLSVPAIDRCTSHPLSTCVL